ncbi:ATP-binding cassette domain-containing protein [Catenulispora yoronensis]
MGGFHRRAVRLALTWIVELLMALPGIVVLLAARAAIGPSLIAAMLVLGVLAAPAFFRVVAASVAALREELFVDAARVNGLSDRRILWRHILPLVRGPILIQAAMVGAVAISIQAGLDFLGLGDPTVPTWGTMLSDAFTTMGQHPLPVLWPSLMIALVCLSLALLANALRDEFGLGGRAGALASAEPSIVPENDGADPASPAEPAGPAGPADPADLADRAPAPVTGDPDPADTLLTIRGLRVGYQAGATVRDVVHGVDLTIRRGEIHGLVGESGAGKTQTAFALLGLLGHGGRVTGGTVEFDGTELTEAAEHDLVKLRGVRIGYIPQEPGVNLSPTATVGSQLCEPLRVRLGLSRAEARDRVLALLRRVGLTDPERVFASYPHQISGGMAQRVLIAGAVSCDPELLVADEPTTALDVTVQAEVLDLLRDLQAERAMTVVLVTHNLGVVADLCDRVSVMRHGRLVETGPVADVFGAPRAPYTRELLAAVLDDAPVRGPLDPVAPAGGRPTTEIGGTV